MKTLYVTTLVLLTVCVAPPLAASELEVVAAIGAREPAGLQAGQRLPANTRLELEPWGRALVRETAKCGLTHVVVGVGEYVLSLADDCADTNDPRQVVGLIQRGEVFAARFKETGSGLADELVFALSNNPCVYLPRFSEEQEGGRQCPSGYALRGFGCVGSYCDDKVLMCCPYLEGAPDPSSKSVQSRWISEEFPNVATSKKYINGLTCRGPYCDDIFPHHFKSSRLANARDCEWTAWVSEELTSWIECDNGQLAAGVRCRGDYCADLALHCCPARVE